MKPVRTHDTNKRRRGTSSSDGNLLGVSSPHTLSDIRQQDSHDSRSRIMTPVPVTSYTKADLSACHICHKRPRVKSDLDGYADCEGCEKRTCFICMRKCRGEIDVDDAEMIFGIEASLMDADNGGEEGNEQGKAGVWRDSERERMRHMEVVCSLCAKECGPDGHVRCNGCLGLAWGG